MRPAVLLTLLASTLLALPNLPSIQVPITINHEKGSFQGSVTVTTRGTHKKTTVAWNGVIRNTSSHRVFRATFCLKAFDNQDQQITCFWVGPHEPSTGHG